MELLTGSGEVLVYTTFNSGATTLKVEEQGISSWAERAKNLWTSSFLKVHLCGSFHLHWLLYLHWALSLLFGPFCTCIRSFTTIWDSLASGMSPVGGFGVICSSSDFYSCRPMSQNASTDVSLKIAGKYPKPLYRRGKTIGTTTSSPLRMQAGNGQARSISMVVIYFIPINFEIKYFSVYVFVPWTTALANQKIWYGALICWSY